MGIPTVVLISMFFIVTVTGQSIFPGVRLSCPAPVDPPNGKITKDCKNRPGVVGSTAEFQCNYGYDGKPGVKGSLTCTLDKTGLYWKANIDCPIRGCDIFNIPPNAKVDELKETCDGCPDNKVPFECKAGFYMKVRVRCQVGFVLGYTHTCEKEPPTFPVCGASIHLIFVIDGSSSVGKPTFDDIIYHIKESIPSWPVGTQDTSIGVVVYSDDVGDTLPVTGDKAELKKELGQLSFPGGQANTYKGIDEAVKMMARTSNSQRVIAVITDGNYLGQAEAKASAGRAEDISYKIAALGVGKNQSIDGLKAIAHRRSKYMYSTPDGKPFSFQFNELMGDFCV